MQNGTFYGTALGFFAGAFGILGGGGKNYNENSTRKYNTDSNKKMKRVADVFKSSQQADVRITGELSVTGGTTAAFLLRSKMFCLLLMSHIKII